MSTETPQLGFHLDGQICRVGCSFCYLGQRVGSQAGHEAVAERTLDPALLAEIVARSPRGPIAVAVSEPARRWRPGLEALAGAARARGVALAITTTPAVVAADPWVLDGATLVSLSLDPEKAPAASDATRLRRGGRARGGAAASAAAEGPSGARDAQAGRMTDAERPRALPAPGAHEATEPRWLSGLEEALAVCQALRRGGARLEIVGLVSVSSPAFAAALGDGLLAELLERPELDAIALNALKPPPAWSDRAFWLRFCASLRPLLARHLHRRLHLDCYVGARVLGLGGCPAKPDISPGREFRACVYQAAPDFVFADAEDLARRTASYRPPDVCPFSIR